MALPSYDEVAEWLRSYDNRPLPAPQKRPTRKGLGRYLRDCNEDNLDLIVFPERWQRRWISCTSAYNVMLSQWGIRLPSDTFLMDKVFVAAELERIRRHAYSEEDLPPRKKAMKWAQTR